MIRKLNKLIFAFLIVGITVYITLNNREVAHLYITEELQFTASLGLIVLSVFGAGILATTFVSVFYGIKSYFRERGYKTREREHEQFLNKMLQARSYSLQEDWGKAISIWESIIDRNSNNLIAKIELSNTLEKSGDIKNAIEVLETAKQKNPFQSEILLELSSLYEKSSNLTSALDNLNVLLSKEKSKIALEKAVNICIKLGKFSDAVEYYSELTEDIIPTRADLLAMQIKEDTLPTQDKIQSLYALHRKNPQSIKILSLIAELEEKNGKIEEAIQNLLKAGKISGEFSLYKKAAILWENKKESDKAISVYKSAINNLTGDPKIMAQLSLAHSYLKKSMFSDAFKILEDVRSNGGNTQNASIITSYHSLRGMYFGLTGDSSGATTSLSKIQENAPINDDYNGVEVIKTQQVREAPSPALSTP